VDLDHVLRPGPLVEHVDVLGHHRADEAPALELGECDVDAVGLGRTERVEPGRIEAPDLARIALERAERRVLERIELGPDARGRAEVRDPALGRRPRAGQDDAGLVVADEGRELVDGRVNRPHRWAVSLPGVTSPCRRG
jgi:hypothetical protein